MTDRLLWSAKESFVLEDLAATENHHKKLYLNTAMAFAILVED